MKPTNDGLVEINNLQTFTKHIFQNTDIVRQYDEVWVKKDDVEKLLQEQKELTEKEMIKRFEGMINEQISKTWEVDGLVDLRSDLLDKLTKIK